MLPANNRLTNDKDFDRTFKKGKSVYGNILGVKAVENHLPYSRFGILVGSKISKKAMVRNRIKRRLRAIIYNNLDQIEKGYDFVIITLPLIKEADYNAIKNELQNKINLLKRCNAFKKRKKNSKYRKQF